MHVTLILGGMVDLKLDDPVPVVSLLILIEMVMDVRVHLNEFSGTAA